MHSKKTKTFTFKKLVLALAIAGYTMGSAYAVLTAPTGSIQGHAPVLSAPVGNEEHAVNLSTNATGATLATGDTITLTYDYTDLDGDADASTAHVTWYYVNGTTETAITAGIINTPATAMTSGTSVMTIPAAAVGADTIKVGIQEYSASGDPISGQTLTIADVSVAGPENPTPIAPGPIAPGGNLTAGIYLSTDTAFANNLIGEATRLNVGDTYVFKLWDGVTDMTGNVTYNWRLVGTSATTNTNAPVGGFVTSTTDGNFTVPTNTQPNGTPLTGSADGAQGFNLAVDYN
ncbi:ornithine carbamoyltransferase [Chania multitudinisentens RB-25]|uniref:Ornithine carbamoyltransferase n=1 Tax=Chania multitudinisentens RB-25 TaxID=1441930 RepID=W0LF85_9GAMM|nr:SinI family autotransporter-associated protein [Chania multitudinisentens]AHG20610.1 ornithine carbamoyltransferase [Chania multitudinisentens RB-25]